MRHQTVLFIGATGILARPVIRQVVEAGFRVKALVRDPQRAQHLLPAPVELIKGDLADRSAIRRAAEGIDAVYINLPATTQPWASFIAELHGTQNILDSIEPQVLVLKLSEIGAGENPHFIDINYKYRSEQLIRAAGNPYVIFQSTWFMDSFPHLLTRDDQIVIYLGGQPNPVHWVAAKDLGRMVASALNNPQPVLNQTLVVQGPEPVTFEEAGNRYIQAYDPRLKLVNLPLWGIRSAAELSGEWLFIQQVMAYYHARQEVFAGQPAWEWLGKPLMRLEDFVREHKQGQY